MMNKSKLFAGIDLSKKSFDAAVIVQGAPISKTKNRKFSNDKTGFELFLRWVRGMFNNGEDLVICIEEVGIYSLPMCVYFEAKQVPYYLISAHEIHKSAGIKRGKTDPADAKMIAEYAYKNIDFIQEKKLPEADIIRIKFLLSQRDRLIKCKIAMQVASSELKQFSKLDTVEFVSNQSTDVIHCLVGKIKEVECQMLDILKNNSGLNLLFNLVTSVPGVGRIVALNFIAYTKGFTAFENSRKFACYAGTAPFPFQSGSSINRNSKVSHMANKKMKSILSNAVWPALKKDPILKAYYDRKVEQGKAKLSVANAIKNKIIDRVFTVVKRKQPYVIIKQ